ncbi:Uncharacterised protein [BD1-7 clade bacterium]|uniref:DUF3127 domain-containing protein n=1 Tax=BD1-7 clade bacterium TaxID=2029982 RepID=A0A5S9Q8S0_9GAMM|nr:Uncharacterised protein [BD1-7 clade bacterium]CAA0114198.1 Uncharacterised protein [BD1-7 clade bacterium]
MSKSYEVQGFVHSIGQTTEYGNNGFTKREFVIKVSGPDENPTYPNYVALELIKDKCALMDRFQMGQEVKVQFNMSGRLWTAPGKPERCFTSLQAWRVEDAQQQPQQQANNQPPIADEQFGGGGMSLNEGFDDIPF